MKPLIEKDTNESNEETIIAMKKTRSFILSKLIITIANCFLPIVQS